MVLYRQSSKMVYNCDCKVVNLDYLCPIRSMERLTYVQC